MRLKKDYHIHSKFSKVNHAKDSVEDIVKVAISKELEEIAITNHGPAHIFFGIKKGHLKNLREEVDRLNKKYPQINILLGMECNITSIDGDTDISDEILKMCDIILCGFHIGIKFRRPRDFFYLIVTEQLSKVLTFLKKGQIKINTAAIVKAMHKNKINILTHPGDKMSVDMEQLAKAAEISGTILEINNSHEHLSVEEIIVCDKYNVKFAINSDAHTKESVGGYKSSLNRAVEANIDLNKIVNLKI